jgi:hypothetical protein
VAVAEMESAFWCRCGEITTPECSMHAGWRPLEVLVHHEGQMEAPLSWITDKTAGREA